MPYKDPDKKKEANRRAWRKNQGYKRGDRPTQFAANFPNADLSLLDEREREVVERYHFNCETTTAIASDLELTRQRVHAILKAAEKKLLSGVDKHNTQD